jgi:hypothetical protein
MEVTSDGERKAIDLVTQRLCASFPTVDEALVDRVVRQAHHRFLGHPTREFVPILVQDAARDILRVMPGTTGHRRP